MMKIALLFLTRKELNHPHFWQNLLINVQEQFNVYIHSKEPLSDPFFHKYRIPEIVPTSYLIHGSAWQVLIREALKDERNVKFIYLSESCIPLYPLSDIYHHLIHDHHTYIRYSKPWWAPDSDREVIEIPIEHRWGNAEWIILNRRHASLIAEDREILELISKHTYSDHEAYPSSLFSLKQCLDEIVYRQTTYANFSLSSGSHPYQFQTYSPEDASYIWKAKRGGCLFARKFAQEFPAAVLENIPIERLMLPPSSILSNPFPTEKFQQKIVHLQALEEMSQANTCALLPMLLNESLFEIGYEIGTGLGLHMERLLQGAHVGKLFGIDEYGRKIYQGISFDPEEEDQLYEYVQKRMEYLGLGAEMIRNSSLKIAESIPDQSVDFVFFNTQHDNTPIRDNLEAWFPKIRASGIISGYQDSTFYPHVQTEIQQFFFDKKLKINQEFIEPKFWWVELQ
jgi:hypothetical protein